MPEQIPILYTGKNVARPDFKSMTQSIQDSFAEARRRKQQQAQFDALQNERATKEFLKNLNVDEIKSTNEGLVNQKYHIYKNLEDQYTEILKNKGKNDQITVQDQLAAKMLQADANQQISKLNESERNWSLDKMAALKNPDIYDLEKAKGIIFNYNGTEPYSESKLDQIYRDMSIEEVRANRFQKMKDPNYFATTAHLGGQNVSGEQEYDETYFNIEDGQVKPDYPAQVGFLKSQTVEEGQRGILSEIAYDKQFTQASEADQKIYKEKARRFTGREDDAKYIYELDQANGQYFESAKFEADKVTKPTGAGARKAKPAVDLRKNTTGALPDPVPLTGTITFYDKNGNKKTVDVQKGKGQLTKITYEEDPANPGKKIWMAHGVVTRPKTMQEGFNVDAVSGNSITERMKMPYTEIEDYIGDKYNVILPPETKKKKAY